MTVTPTSTSTSQSIRRHLTVGGIMLFVCGGGFLVWAFGTELSGAVIAPGTLVVDSFVKKVQHQTGGIVKDILVREGDTVREGDVLLRFDETVAQANLALITNELDQLAAARARAEAEREGVSKVRFPEDLLGRSGDPVVATLLAGVRTQFASGVAAREGQQAQLRQRLVQLRMQLEGLQKQITAKKREIALVASELVGVRDLWQKKLIQLTRVNGLERDDAKAEGEYGQLNSSLGEIGGKIAETELQILQIDQELRKEDDKELEQNRTRTSELLERKIAAEDQLRRLEVRAPQSGTVHELSVHTIGGVVTPTGEPIMLIVPAADVLKIDAKMQPLDIDQVHIGETVQVRLSGLNQRTTPELKGQVTGLSPDSISDPKTGAGFFKVRVDFTKGEIARLEQVKLVPGMPCEILIETSAPRTIFSYLIKPISDQMFRAFR